MLIRNSLPSDQLNIQKLIEKIYLDFANRNQEALFNWPSDKTESLLNRYKFLLSFGPSSSIGDFEEPFAFICYQELTTDDETDIEIIVLGVSPERRRSGLMKALLTIFVENMRSKKFKIYLEVHEKNRAALQFYENFGFQTDGIRKNYYSDGSAALNMTLIKRSI